MSSESVLSAKYGSIQRMCFSVSRINDKTEEKVNKHTKRQEDIVIGI